MHVPFGLTDRPTRRDRQVVGRLQVEPELRRVPEVAHQTERRIGGDATPAVHDLAHPGHWYAEVSHQGVDAEAERRSIACSPQATAASRLDLVLDREAA